MPPQPARRVALSALPVALAFVLAACASGGKTRSTRVDRPFASRLLKDDAAIVHFLNRSTFGVLPGDIEQVRRLGVDAFLDRQMHPEQIDDSALQARLASFDTLKLSSKELAEQYYQPAQEARRRRQIEMQAAAAAGRRQAAGGSQAPPATSAVAATQQPPPFSAADQELFRKERLVLQELSEQKVLRAVYSERQLQEVLVDFWFNHFNVFAGKGADRGLLTAYERDVVRPRVFGRFRDLLGATAESPAMLFFLDNWMSVDPNGPHLEAGGGGREAGRPAAAGAFRRPPAAYRLPPARPPAKKPTRGLNENYARELMELHTLGVDGGYTQKDVVEVARCFTGWTIAQPRDGGAFSFDERQHDPGQKVVLAHVIKPGGGKSDGDQVLDILSRDPHTAHFIATKLVRRFVADDPPPALVDRVARRFRETDGDLREVYRAIFLSREFWSNGTYTAKTKTPFEFVASALRTAGAQIDDATSVVQAIRSLGMPLYFCQPPTGYADRADAWVNTGALLNRMNFALALVGNRLPGVHLDTGPADAPERIALKLGGPEFQKR